MMIILVMKDKVSGRTFSQIYKGDDLSPKIVKDKIEPLIGQFFDIVAAAKTKTDTTKVHSEVWFG